MKKAIVVAHPDDEILFFSSIIEKVDAVIVCFGQSKTKKVTDGRRLLPNRYPLKNIEWLSVQESNVFLSANWYHPKLTDYGILVRRNQNEYQKNFITLVKLFKTKLASIDNKRLRSFTANPPVMFLTASFKSSYLRRWTSQLLPPTLKEHLKKIMKRVT